MNYFKLHKYQFSNGRQSVVKSGHNFKALKAEAIKELNATPDTLKVNKISIKKIFFQPFNK